MNHPKKGGALKRYSLADIFYLARCYLYTKLWFKGARIIRLPFDIRGRKQVVIGANFTTGKYCRIEIINEPAGDNRKKLFIGKNVQINDNVHLACTEKMTIGDNVLIASKVFITDHNHGNYNALSAPQTPPSIPPIERELQSSPVIIEDNVWIGEFVSVMPGVTIGKGAIIGTMSVVTKDIPPNSIAVGAPAKVIKTYNFNSKKWEKI